MAQLVKELSHSLSQEPFPLLGAVKWDSGENPAVGSAVPAGVSVNLQTDEVWIVSRGNAYGALDIGNGAQAFYYATQPSGPTANQINFYNGGINALIPGTFWPRFSNTVHGYRGNGANSLIPFINGHEYAAQTVTTPTSTSGGEVGGWVGTSALSFEGDVRRVLITNGAFSAKNRSDLLFYLRDRYGFQKYDVQLICDGDSKTPGYSSRNTGAGNGWTAGDLTASFAYQLSQTHPNWKILNKGIASVTIATLRADGALGVDPYYDAKAFSKNIVLLFGAGLNDIFFGTAEATVKADIAGYVTERKAAGWEVWITPPTDRTDFTSGQRTIQQNVETWVLAGSSGADRIIANPPPFAGASPWSTGAHAKYWDSDHIHYSRTGNLYWADVLGTINTNATHTNLTVANIATIKKLRTTPVPVAYAAAIELNIELGNIFNLATLTGNTTITVYGEASDSEPMLLRIKQDATGGRTITWDAAFQFTDDVISSSINTAANKYCEVLFRYHLDRTKWVAQAINNG